MARYTNAICRKCRRAGAKLYLKGERCITPKCAFTRRSYAPGNKGAKGGNFRKSDYALQLAEKQKTKAIFGILEKQFRNYFNKSTKSVNTGLTLLINLETRLDNVIKHSNFAASTRSARQFVNHGSVTVNGKKVSTPNYQVKPGDKIKIKKALKKSKEFTSEIPKWIKVDNKNMTVEIIAIPKREEMSQDVNEELIVELYSR